MEQKRDRGLGVPARRLAVALSACTPRSFLAAGYPLRSLTRILLLTLGVVWAKTATCQTEQGKQSSTIIRAELRKLPVVDSSALVKFIPLTYAPVGSNLTDTLIVTGIISEQSSAGVFCGVICHSGTIKIEVTQVLKGQFDGKALFAVIPCFVRSDEDLGRKIRMTVTLLPSDRDIGCYSNVWNTIDSHGVPFYFSEEDHIERP